MMDKMKKVATNITIVPENQHTTINSELKRGGDVLGGVEWGRGGGGVVIAQ
jgi:hypothetical protein